MDEDKTFDEQADLRGLDDPYMGKDGAEDAAENERSK